MVELAEDDTAAAVANLTRDRVTTARIRVTNHLYQRGPVHAGVAVMTAELFRWRALRDRSICRGERFAARSSSSHEFVGMGARPPAPDRGR